MNTGNFISATNDCANKLQSDLDVICKVNSISKVDDGGMINPNNPGIPGKIINPAILPGGGDAFDPIGPIGPVQPTNGSFATHSIENIPDFLNFVKASFIILLGSSLNPAMLIPANIIILSSLAYGLRNQIKKITLKSIIHGHRKI